MSTTATTADSEIKEIRDFWEHDPCGHETSVAEDPINCFRELERYRDDRAPWIPAAKFNSYTGRRVLEIGTDGAQFAAASADYTGIDLAEAAVALARENFQVRVLS